jgi:hypothetical protein
MVQLLSFNPAMQAALRSNSKTVTRRRFARNLAINEEPNSYLFLGMEAGCALFKKRAVEPASYTECVSCPFGLPGTQLRVTEVPDILLEIVGVRAEQIQMITEADALAEGLVPGWLPSADGLSTQQGYSADSSEANGVLQGSAVGAFRCLIDSIYPTAWERNEWVWVVEFKRLH